MIRIHSLSKSFKKNVVLDGIDLAIEKGDVISVIGPSGTGKSTLLRCIDHLEVPDQGRIDFPDLSVDLSLRGNGRREIVELHKRTGMVFQSWNLFSHKTALENVMEGLVVVKGLDKKTAREKALQELDKVGLYAFSGHYPRHLSGGQQQRVAIARALAMEPELLLLDEPTSALDPELVGEVLDTIRAAAEEGYTMLLVSHEMNFVRNVSSRVLFLEGGKIVEDGPPRQVFRDPKSERLKAFIEKINRLQGPEYII